MWRIWPAPGARNKRLQLRWAGRRAGTGRGERSRLVNQGGLSKCLFLAALLILLCVPALARPHALDSDPYYGNATYYHDMPISLGYADGYQGVAVRPQFWTDGLEHAGGDWLDDPGGFGDFYQQGWSAGDAERQRVAGLSTGTGGSGGTGGTGGSGTGGGACVTSDQGAALIAAMYTQSDISQAQGHLLAQNNVWLNALCILLCIAIFFVALRRYF